MAKWHKSARFVLTLWSSVVIMGGIVVFGLSVYLYLEHLQERSLRDMLLEEVAWIHQIVDIEREHLTPGSGIDVLSLDVEKNIVEHFTANPRNFIVILASDQGLLLYQSGTRVGGSLPLPPPTRDTTYVESVDDPAAGRLRVAVRRAYPFVIQVAFPDTVGKEVLQRLLTIFSVLTPVVLFLALAGGWVLTGTVLRPLRRVSQTAQRITAESLDERIPARDVEDEFGELITTMNRMISRLQESFGQMREFLMNVAHELRTPLTIIKGESELALSRQLTLDDAREVISSHLRESVRMSRIVDDLILLAKAEAGQLMIEDTRVRLDEMLTELYEDAQILAAEHQHDVELGSNAAVTVPGDPARLRQLFRILVTNAIQYTDPKGRIRIESRADDRQVHVTIEDNGMGIPPDSLTKIFDRFYRTDAARTRSHHGSGLGLPIARWIAESHHGTISVESAVGKGSRFTVTLPLSRP